jgi:hypothetical protein
MDDPNPVTPPPGPGPARRGRSSLIVYVAAALILAGAVWMLQGLGILTAGGSFMIGDPTWVVIGAATVVLGAGIGLRAVRR